MQLSTQMEDYSPWYWLAGYVFSLLCGSAAGLGCFMSKGFWKRKLRFALSALLLLLSIAALGRTSAGLHELANPHDRYLLEKYAFAPEKFFDEVPASFAMTDCGQRIPLFQLRLCDETSVVLAQSRLPEAFSSLVVSIAPPDVQTNCHGWVFTGGKAIIRGCQVDTILTDNDYRIVSEPSAGDLIVYRDFEGDPIHTGVVKAAGRGGVIIESKWGFCGRYLHEPQDQCYSQAFAYYRSARAGHALWFANEVTVQRAANPPDGL